MLLSDFFLPSGDEPLPWPSHPLVTVGSSTLPTEPTLCANPFPPVTFPASAWSWPAFCSAPRSSCSRRGAWGGSRWWRGGAGRGRHTAAGAGSGTAGLCGGAGARPAGCSSGLRRMPGRGLAPLQAYRSWLSLEVVEATVWLADKAISQGHQDLQWEEGGGRCEMEALEWTGKPTLSTVGPRLRTPTSTTPL